MVLISLARRKNLVLVELKMYTYSISKGIATASSERGLLASMRQENERLRVNIEEEQKSNNNERIKLQLKIQELVILCRMFVFV